MDNTNTIVVFTGNTIEDLGDRTEVRHVLSSPFDALKVRIIPITYNRFPALRYEVYVIDNFVEV